MAWYWVVLIVTTVVTILSWSAWETAKMYGDEVARAISQRNGSLNHAHPPSCHEVIIYFLMAPIFIPIFAIRRGIKRWLSHLNH